MSAVKKLEF